MPREKIFDTWTEPYDRWFETPIGRLVYDYERSLILEMVRPAAGEIILDAGCGTGVFTRDLIGAGCRVAGLELSLPMLCVAGRKMAAAPFFMVQGDICQLPFADRSFDKTVSITALEFIGDARRAIDELFRVTRPGGAVVVATLNSLSPWAVRRKKMGRQGHPIFRNAVFRSPADLNALAPVPAKIRSAVHFPKNADPEKAASLEAAARDQDTGAFLIARWQKPAP